MNFLDLKPLTKCTECGVLFSIHRYNEVCNQCAPTYLKTVTRNPDYDKVLPYAEDIGKV
jgi:hypothetical protein